jgi:hypothetical protein
MVRLKVPHLQFRFVDCLSVDCRADVLSADCRIRLVFPNITAIFEATLCLPVDTAIASVYEFKQWRLTRVYSSLKPLEQLGQLASILVSRGLITQKLIRQYVM